MMKSTKNVHLRFSSKYGMRLVRFFLCVFFFGLINMENIIA